MLLRRCVRFLQFNGSAVTTGAAVAPTNPAWRFYAAGSSSESGSGGGASSSSSDAEAALLEELRSMTMGPIQIGNLFKALSKESREVLLKRQIPLETYLLKHKDHFKVFKPVGGREIFVCAPHVAPVNAIEGRAAQVGQLFDEKQPEGESAWDRQRIYTVLKFIPNEWSAFSSLGIPDEVLKTCIGKKPKMFFEKYPKYFEVKNQNLRSHTFEVRRSLALQQHVEKQQQQKQRR